MRICTLNVKTLKEETRLIEFGNALKGKHWDILGLSENRRNYETIRELKEMNTILFHGKAKNGLYGVGFIV